jgi:uncharacterized protein
MNHTELNGPIIKEVVIPEVRGAVTELKRTADEVGGPYRPDPAYDGSVGTTHFDSTGAEDNLVTVLLPKENMGKLPLQTLVRIKSLEDNHTYIASVVSGPFAEPEGLKAESPILVSTTVNGRPILAKYHGRAYAQIIAEEVAGHHIPPRFRPRPISPVFPLTSEETAAALKVGGDVRLGLMMGHEDIEVAIPSDRKAVLPRHTGILGTTGSGKSTTVSGLACEMSQSEVSTIIIDVEGEYTEMDHPTQDRHMLMALERRGLEPHGVRDFAVHHLVGRETSREILGKAFDFCLPFSELSPYMIMEILEMNDAQQERFHLAYETASTILQQDLKVFNRDEEALLLDYDELESGFPKMTLALLLDVTQMIFDMVSKNPEPTPPFSAELRKVYDQVRRSRIDSLKDRTSNKFSWLWLLGRLHRLRRYNIFDNAKSRSLKFGEMIKPGKVSVIDLSDTDSPQLNNLIISSILRGVQAAQEKAVLEAAGAGKRPTPTVLIIEEAHEFLSSERIKQMPVLFQQVAKIAKRGRKRWLGLTFVTQSPQHLPNEVLGLINNFVLHKISDSGVIDRLRKSISGLDKSQWGMVSALAAGQAVVSLTSLTRPLLVSVDPAPCRLKLIE